MKTFDTFEDDIGLKECVKRPVIIHALQINYPFRVKSLDGDYVQGEVGDYLVRDITGEHFIYDKEIFEESYDFMENV